MEEFPEVKGFSKRNLELIRQWYRYWSADPQIAKQAVAQLSAIPWGHKWTFGHAKAARAFYLYISQSSDNRRQPVLAVP
jgi:hypothetical protein